MADKKINKTASKTTKQVRASSLWSNDSSSSTSNKKSTTAKKTTAAVVGAVGARAVAKSLHKKTLVIVIVSFLIALLLGGAVCFIMGKNDVFEIVGNEELELEIGQTYADEGVRIVEFGIDVSKRAKVRTNLKTNNKGEYYGDEEKTYYLAYTVDTIKFGVIYKVTKIRLITFYEPHDDDEFTREGE